MTIYSGTLSSGTHMHPSTEKSKKKHPILDLDVLEEKNTWWVIWEYMFSGKLRQPEDIINS